MLKFFLLPLLSAAIPAAASAQPAARATATGEPFILAFGDSLTAGYGLGRGLGFAPQLEAALRRHGIKASVHDAGVSGDTSSGGRARLGWTLDGLPRKPDLAIVELGANDMLRGVDPGVTEANIDAIVGELDKRGIPVLVAGMLSAPNLDPRYRSRFDRIFPTIARKYDATLYPFFLQGVVGNRALALPDGVHPNFEGIKRIVTGILPTVQRALARRR
ncbi:arylesterase [Sphingomonas sp. BN140010]|uniref:Arylesterase n=1 Tax=Sphingomonas arvum TaxID=2992113 RepID=A0ABT3JB22_9SPHN|nr:arylesterase [Sphingomonas sp. BN140010]MCW3796262.1 arylesterase [Sphingomonas sp. BN140010]